MENKMTDALANLSVLNVDPGLKGAIREVFHKAAKRLRIDPATESMTLDGQILTFRTPTGSVIRHIYVSTWSNGLSERQVEEAMHRMRHDVAMVRAHQRDVVPSNIVVSIAAAKAFMLLGGTAAQLRQAVLEGREADGRAPKITLGRADGTRIVLAVAECQYQDKQTYVVESFTLPGVASGILDYDGMVINAHGRMEQDRLDRIGVGEGLAEVLGHDLFNIHPFAVNQVNQKTGTMRTLMRRDVREASFEATGGIVERTVEDRLPDTDIDALERHMLDPAAPHRDEMREPNRKPVEGCGRTVDIATRTQNAARQAFLSEMAKSRDPWQAVVDAVLGAMVDTGLPPATVTSVREAPSGGWESKPVEFMHLDTRARNCILNTNAATVWEIDQMTDAELLRIPNLGRRTLGEVRAAIQDMKTKEAQGLGSMTA